jgi:hypothetical protein
MSTSATDSFLPRHAEIANLEHELAVLHERHANIVRRARFVRPLYFVTLALRAGGCLVALVQRNAVALAFSAVCFLMLAAVGLVFSEARMIDIVSSGRWNYPEISHARFLEKATAAREQRLTALRNDP